MNDPYNQPGKTPGENTPQEDMLRDAELAALTDAILAQPNAPRIAATVPDERIIRTMFELSSGTPSTDFRSRLTARLNQEWDVVEREKRARPAMRVWHQQPITRYAFAAAAAVVMLGVLIVVRPNTTAVSGTALGDGDIVIIVGGLAAIALVVGVALNWRNRK